MASTALSVALALLAGKAAASACPGSPAMVHAKAQVSVTFSSNTCDEVKAEIKARVAGENGWVDPHNHGTYTLLGEDDSSLKIQRLTGNGKYTDVMGFSFSTSGSGCQLEGCSESQVFSIADFSTNFCNLHDLYCGSADGCPIASKDFSYAESAQTSLGASKDKSACIVKQETKKVTSELPAAATECPPSGFDTQGALEGGFDLDWYTSKPWYIQQQAPIKYLPEDYFFCVRARYELLSSPTLLGYNVKVHNYAQNATGAPLGPVENICAKIVDKAAGKLEVAPCFLPPVLAGPYWVVAFNQQEGWALVSGGKPTIKADGGCRTGTETNDSGLWIFTRQEQRDESIVAKVRSLAVAKGFDISVLKDVVHSNCNYPDATLVG